MNSFLMRKKRWFKNCFVGEFDVLLLFLFLKLLLLFFYEAPISPFNVVVLMLNGVPIPFNDALPFSFQCCYCHFS
jgi:hypothetical protein